MNDRPATSKALREVWEWKDAAYREVAHLPRREALRVLLDRAEHTARAMRLDHPALAPPPTRMVAEEPGEYRTAVRGKQD
jgi:hypothetical protein